MTRNIKWAKPGFHGIYGVLEDGTKYVRKWYAKNYTGDEWAEKVRLERNARRRARYAAQKAAKSRKQRKSA